MERVKLQPAGNAQAILCKKYLRPLKEPGLNAPTSEIDRYEQHMCQACGKSHETVEELLTRCSFGNEDFYNLLASLDFVPGSPVWFNAGTNQGTMSACFKFDVDDTMVETENGILPVATKAALVLKWGGGVGFYLGKIRPKNALIRTTHGKACGPVAVMEYYHAGALLITQSGKRQAAQMGILPCDHADIQEFIHCKDSGTNLSTFNISVSCTDEFMKRATEEPESKEAQLFSEMVECAWKKGDPGIYFIDTAERDNPTPWLGKLTGTNPCGEVPLLDNEACNLGSINLAHMFVEGKNVVEESPAELIDWTKLERTARLGVRYLDAVIDNNEYPLQVITDTVHKTRKIGLGVMGWADLLAQMHVHYDSQMALDLADQVMSHIQDWAHDESLTLGSEKGFYPAFDDKEGDSYGPPKRRNAIVTCIAPAGTISQLANCSSGIEPHFTLEGTRMMGDGTILKENVRTDTKGFVPHVAHQIDHMWQLQHQSIFQKHTDLAVSKTVNFPKDATREQVRETFVNAWKLGCKGVTIYRDGSRDVQVINETKPQDAYQSYETDTRHGLQRRKMPKDAMAYRHSFSVGGVEGYLHIGLFEDNTPGELFITGSNQGSTVSGLLASLSIMTSLGLQYGVPLETMVSKLQHIRFEPMGMTDDPKIPTAPSIVAYIYRYMGQKCLTNGHAIKSAGTGMVCPDCGAAAVAEEGCLKCSKGCGWSRCG